MEEVVNFLTHYSSYLYYGCLLGLITFLSYHVAPKPDSFSLNDRWFFGLAIVGLLIARLPSIFFADLLNVDETQMIAEALTLLQDPVYWRSVDGTTIGPINSYLLAWPGLLHLPITYVTCRLTAIALLGLTSWLLFTAMREWLSPVSSRLSLLVFMLFLWFTTYFDYLHCSSELPALPIIAYCWLMLVRLYKRPTYFKGKPINWLMTGFLAGLIPFIKLQAVPIIAIIVLALVVRLANQSTRKPFFSATNKPLGLVLAGGLLPSLLVIAWATLLGVTDRMFVFYFKSNLFNYSEYYKDLYPNTQLPIWSKLARLPSFFAAEPTFGHYVWLCLLATSLAIAWRLYGQHQLTTAHKWLIGWSLCWLGMACYAVAMPATEYGHHLWFVLLPLTWLLSLAVQELLANWKSLSINRGLLVAITIVPSLLQVAAVHQAGIKEANYYLYQLAHQQTARMNPVSSIISSRALPGDRLVVWGWQNRYHVDTQLPQGTSENTSFRSMYPHSLRQAYRHKYLTDILSSQPTFFLDATGPNSLFMSDTTRYRFENFKPLAHYIATHYQLVGQLDHVRIYQRTDRVRHSQLLVGNANQ
ncbi:hypothetical protein [Spirosoma aerophilum]